MTTDAHDLARQLWHTIEPIHALTYFGNRTQEACEALGMRGFWMSYFACRAAPMGAVSAPTVAATFFNFNPVRVARAIPGAWGFASPEQVLTARFEAVGRTASDVLGPHPDVPDELLHLAATAAEGAACAGRPLAAANAAVDATGESAFVQLWQATTVLRESRGDGHIAALVDAELNGIEALVLFSACGGPPLPLFEASRGWSSEDFTRAQHGLMDRGILAADGTPSAEGKALHTHIEATTDRLASGPVLTLGSQRTVRFIELAQDLTDQIAASSLIPYPNPIGLPRG
ncbi:MAG: hypothetical protein WC054_09585 [Candidatus Nanopelagicales bacterium]